MTVSISGAIDFLQDKYALSPALQGLVISSIMIGGVIGAGFSGFLSDKYGPPPKHWSPPSRCSPARSGRRWRSPPCPRTSPRPSPPPVVCSV